MSLTAAAAFAVVRPFLLPALLVVSMAGNALQWRANAVRAAEDAAVHAGEIATAVERGKRLQAEANARQAAELVDLARADAAVLLSVVRGIAADAGRVLDVYETRIAELPEPDCAPGAERQAAVNAALRGG
jgi:hypothetical protein